MSKYPNPAIVNRATQNQDGTSENPQEIFPIMSISKSFCGAVCALKAVEGDFGPKGIDTQLSEVLAQARKQYPKRSEAIDEYMEMLQQKGISDIKISELLNHTSGIVEDESAPASYKDKTPLEFFSEKMRKGDDRGRWRYNNTAYILLEEIIGLASQAQSYKSELQTRVLDPLELTSITEIYESAEAQSRVSQVDLIPGFLGQNGLVVKEAKSYNPLEIDAFGKVPLAAGGLCSNLMDMEKYAAALGQMVVGRESSLTQKMPENRRQEIAKIYKEAKAENGYSLGVSIEDVGDKTVIYHDGGFPANSSNMVVEISANPAIAPQTNIMMEQQNYIAAMLLNPNTFPRILMKEYLNECTDASEKQKWEGSFHRAHVAHLVEQGNLPADFLSEDYDKFFGLFEKVVPDMQQFLKENYLKDGVIDNEKLQQNFKSFDGVLKVMSGFESFQNSQKDAQEMLGKFFFNSGLKELKAGKSECKEAFQIARDKGFDVKNALKENQESITESTENLKEFQKIIVEKICRNFGDEKSAENDSQRS